MFPALGGNIIGLDVAGTEFNSQTGNIIGLGQKYYRPWTEILSVWTRPGRHSIPRREKMSALYDKTIGLGRHLSAWEYHRPWTIISSAWFTLGFTSIIIDLRGIIIDLRGNNIVYRLNIFGPKRIEFRPGLGQGRDGIQFSVRKISSALGGNISGLGPKYHRPGRGRGRIRFPDGKYHRPWTMILLALGEAGTEGRTLRERSPA